MKNDTGKWCDFHKNPLHNTDEYRLKNSLVVEVKDIESNLDSESDQENIENIQIINTDPTAIVATTTIQLEEPLDSEEGERLFHSQMWVKGTLLHFIVDNDNQRSSYQLRSSNNWGFRKHNTRIHTTSVGFTKDKIFMSANNVAYPMASIPSRMR